MRLLARLRAILFLSLVFGSVMTIGFVTIVVSAILHKPILMRRLSWGYCRIIFPLFGIQVIVEGFEKLERDKRYVFASNHQSFLDIMLMMGWLRFPAFLAKHEIRSWPWFGWAMSQMGCVFVDRNNRRDRIDTARRVREALRLGNDFCIFPEGTRSADGSLHSFQSGVFHLATGEKTLLAPVVIDGTGEILNKHGFRMYPGTIRLAILDPIDLAQETWDHKDLAREVQRMVTAQLDSWRDSTALCAPSAGD